ncbi:protein-tyrosine phosphatase-like protein [Lactarius pseudohatsudake]|nr:protein-tyrosine phosphatase-like protein [Lactarius pseudohatsudake]
MSFGVPFFELSFFQHYPNSLQDQLEKQHTMRPDRSAARHNKRVASKIAPRLYLTCRSTASDVAQMTSLGITHLLSILEVAPTFPSTVHLRRLHVSISDYDSEDILTHLPTTTSFIRGALAESPSNRVMVHCAMGVSRSATVVIAYLIATSRMTVHEALAAVRAKRPIVRPNRGFVSQLHEYHSRFSNSLQAEIIDEPPIDEKREQEKSQKDGKPRWDHSTRSSREAANGYVYKALAALTLSPVTAFPHERFGGHEYWKLEHRIS